MRYRRYRRYRTARTTDGRKSGNRLVSPHWQMGVPVLLLFCSVEKGRAALQPCGGEDLYEKLATYRNRCRHRLVLASASSSSVPSSSVWSNSDLFQSHTSVFSGDDMTERAHQSIIVLWCDVGRVQIFCVVRAGPPLVTAKKHRCCVVFVVNARGISSREKGAPRMRASTGAYPFSGSVPLFVSFVHNCCAVLYLIYGVFVFAHPLFSLPFSWVCEEQIW